MDTILYVIIFSLIAALVWIVLAAREKLQGLRSENLELEERARGLARQLTVESLHGQAAKLSAKLTTARAPVAAQIERYKHQNNELRVSMSRMHRLMTGGDYVGAMEAWVLMNRWLEKNTIEPYLGTVPGVEYAKDVAQN